MSKKTDTEVEDFMTEPKAKRKYTKRAEAKAKTEKKAVRRGRRAGWTQLSLNLPKDPKEAFNLGVRLSQYTNGSI